MSLRIWTRHCCDPPASITNSTWGRQMPAEGRALQEILSGRRGERNGAVCGNSPLGGNDGRVSGPAVAAGAGLHGVGTSSWPRFEDALDRSRFAFANDQRELAGSFVEPAERENPI